MYLSASLVLPGAAREDLPSVEGRVSSEDKATPVVLFIGRTGVSSMRPMGGCELIVFGDGVMLLLLVWTQYCLNKTLKVTRCYQHYIV
jgi:hypothetical protein